MHPALLPLFFMRYIRSDSALDWISTASRCTHLACAHRYCDLDPPSKAFFINKPILPFSMESPQQTQHWLVVLHFFHSNASLASNGDNSGMFSFGYISDNMHCPAVLTFLRASKSRFSFPSLCLASADAAFSQNQSPFAAMIPCCHVQYHTICTIRNQLFGLAFASCSALTSVLIERSFPSYSFDRSQLST